MSRPLNTTTRVLSLLLALSAAISLSAGPPPCGDITKIDLKNMTLTVPDQGPVTLKNGKGEIHGEILNGVDEGPQWYVALDDDIILRPEPGLTFRLIDLWFVHLDGAGELGHALMYECEGGSLHLVFQAGEYENAIDLKKINERTFTLGRAVYLKTDCDANPSMQATDTYVWSPKEHTFKRVETVEESFKQN